MLGLCRCYVFASLSSIGTWLSVSREMFFGLIQKLLVWFWSLLYMVMLNVEMVHVTLEIG